MGAVVSQNHTRFVSICATVVFLAAIVAALVLGLEGVFR
jgi:hypothetical protein